VRVRGAAPRLGVAGRPVPSRMHQRLFSGPRWLDRSRLSAFLWRPPRVRPSCTGLHPSHQRNPARGGPVRYVIPIRFVPLQTNSLELIQQPQPARAAAPPRAVSGGAVDLPSPTADGSTAGPRAGGFTSLLFFAVRRWGPIRSPLPYLRITTPRRMTFFPSFVHTAPPRGFISSTPPFLVFFFLLLCVP